MNFRQLRERVEKLNVEGKIKFTTKGKVECDDQEVQNAFKEIPVEIIAAGYNSVMGYLKAFK